MKGAKVDKKKKKKAKKDKSSLEKNLSQGDDSTAITKKDTPDEEEPRDADEERDDGPSVTKTEAELRFEEHRKKRVSPEQLP